MGKFNPKAVGGKKPFQKRKKPGDGAVKKVEEKAKITKPVVRPTNPFEIKINKQKFQVLGRPTKHERGLPGVSRARALKKRQTTLLQEYKNKFKSNRMVDKRLGENNPNLSVEGKMEMRYLAEKMKSQNKKSKFLLGDDEVLTHRGQALADIEKFDDPRSESEDDDELRLSKSFVSDAHFGGGILKKGDESEEARQNRESLIDNLIAESKKRKEERQKEREETDDLTDKLDQEYKDVLDVIAGSKNPKKSEALPVKLPHSAYDILVRELRFDPRVVPGEKLKSADELARIEKEKLDKLEADRLKRMKGDVGVGKKVPHRSADDLDDGFCYQPAEPEVKTLSFNVNEREEGSDPQDAGGDESGEEEEEEGEEEEESGSEGDDDNYSDLDSSDDDEGDASENRTTKNSEPPKTKGTTLVRRQNDAKEEMPFVFNVPEEYDEFHQLLQSYTDSKQRIVLERMIKSNHPALNGANKPKMEKVFAFLMQYVHDVASGESLQLLNDLAPVAYDLSQLIPSATAASTLLDVLLEKREELSSGGKKNPVSIATLVFLKLTTLIFPTSDFRHPITTPAFHLLLETLGTPVVSLQGIQVGLGLCAVAYEFVSLSRRYVPEVVHYLHGIVQLAIPRPANVAAKQLVFPFRPVGVESQLLVLAGENTQLIDAERIKLVPTELDDKFRVAALSTAIQLLANFSTLWSELPSVIDIFRPVLTNLRGIPVQRYNAQLGSAVQSLIGSLEELGKLKRKPLIHEAKKPKPLRLYEPAVENNFDGKKKRIGSKEKLEREKLQHKLKREMKGAIREIRKDNAFLARQKIQEQIEKDTERKRKVKDLLSSLANQEGEIRKMKKPKKK